MMQLGALIAEMTNHGLESLLQVEKQDDGRWRIVAISTAAVKDREGETFTTQAMDYDSNLAATTGDYPEFRVFHKKMLGIGRVEKMSRVGIFAVDEGYSYDDSFSQEVCEKMLAENTDGKWKISRGFYVLEANGVCPVCGDNLVVRTKHMVAGFRCPTCKTVHINKGMLKEMHFRKTRTFDVTVTDIPAVPYTGVAAFRNGYQSEDFVMKKEDLKKKLLAAGISESAVDARLETLTDAQLKEFDDIPEAEILKEFDDEPASDEQIFVLDETVLKQFADIVDKKVKEALDGMTFEVPDMEIDLKELPQIDALKVEITELKELVGKLLDKDEQRLKELLDETPRAGKLRIRRFKAATKPAEDEDDEEDMDEEDDEEEAEKKHILSGVIYGADGEQAASMTEFLLGK